MTLADFVAIELLVADVVAQNYIYEDVALDALAVRHGYADFGDYNFARDAARITHWHLQDEV
jgi:hypothetical protein